MGTSIWRLATSGWLPKAFIGLGLGMLFFWLAVRQTNLEAVHSAFLQITWQWIPLALGFYAVAVFVRIVRWRILLRPVMSLSFRQVALALIVGYAVNNILPARLGEVFRADFCKRRFGGSRTAVLGTIAIERLTDGVAVVLILALGQISLPTEGEHFEVVVALLFSSAMLFGVLSLVLLMLSGSQSSGSRRVPNPFTRLPEILRQKRIAARIPFWSAISSRFASFRDSISIIRSRVMLHVLLLTALVWLFDVLSIWAVLNAIGISLGVLQICLVVGIVSLSTLLPSAPGFLGTMQLAFVIGVTTFGYATAQGIVAASTSQLFLLAPITVLGLLFLGVVHARSVVKLKYSSS